MVRRRRATGLCVTLRTMRGRSLRVGTWLLASVVLGCAPAPSPSPAVTAPPVPSDVAPWGDVLWATADLPAAPAVVTGERVSAVAASEQGFVGVGFREHGDARDGVAWFSADGSTWTAATDPIFREVELVDVAAAPHGYVAVGSTSPDADQPQAVVFGSSDGRTWRRLPALSATGETEPSYVAGGSVGLLVVGSDASGAVAAWRSADGTTFQRVTLSGPAIDGLVDPHAIDDGFVALGTKDGAPALLRSADGTSWDATTIDARTDTDASSLVVGRWGIVVQGSRSPDCEDADACVPTDLGWWSADGGTWGILPTDADSPVVNGVSLLVTAGDHGLLAVDGADAWASPDGWRWRPLPEPGDGSVDVDDAVVRDGVIVAVGTQPSDVDDTSVARILVGHAPSG